MSSEDTLDTSTQGYFYTDWSAMTSQDWAGMMVTLVTFILMAIAYFYVFRPKNKDKLEAQKYMLLDDQDMDEPSFDKESTNTEKNNVGK
jgi:cytochrome c oxidase cbb3-type subunit 4